MDSSILSNSASASSALIESDLDTSLETDSDDVSIADTSNISEKSNYSVFTSVAKDGNNKPRSWW